MTASVPVATVNGCPIYPDDEKLGDLLAYRGDTFLGVAFPQIVDKPDKKWFARKTGQSPARLYGSRREALHWLTREETR